MYKKNIKTTLLLSTLIVFAAACGDDPDTLQNPLLVGNNCSGCSGNNFVTAYNGGVPLVAGDYIVQMTPLSSSCYNYQPLPTQTHMAVSQFGDTLYLDSGDGQIAPFNLSVNLPPYQGPVFSNGSFNAYTSGYYNDPYVGGVSPIDVTMSGYFDGFGMQGVRDTVLFDPGVGGACVISHSFFGSRL